MIEYLHLNMSWFAIDVVADSDWLGTWDGDVPDPHFRDQEKQPRDPGLQSLHVTQFRPYLQIRPYSDSFSTLSTTLILLLFIKGESEW